MTRIFPTLAALAAVTALAACNQPSANVANAVVATPKAPPVQYDDALARRANALSGDSLQSRADSAGDRAADRTRKALASGGYQQAVGDSDCTEDCAGDAAGYAWARSRKIEEPGNCPNDRGEAFEEGCRAYGETIQGARDEARDAALNGKGPPS